MKQKTRAVCCGNVKMGAGAPISVQSMTNTYTGDAEKTIAQVKALETAGCDIVRLAVNDTAAAAAVRAVKDAVSVPLVADIHFDHRLAIASMENGIDKIRFNPGNIGSEAKVKELVSCAKVHRVPIRIGVNAGSLDKALLARYGAPTPEALAESALSHVRILEHAGFYDIVISAKISSVQETVETYRILHKACDYPLHVGVTEAGGGETARIKSAIGIGALLLDGIGDTLRVSLTGDPVQEVEAGKMILRVLGLRKEGVEVISCPTCGRCKNIEAHGALAERVAKEFTQTGPYLKAAVMGCAVNGPGEAREADIGIAFGRTNAVVFKRGEQAFSGELPAITERFLKEMRMMLQEREKQE
ncbi:MAG: flavodoxin-dependent (E)-4-hydroxy-3-methylbut-2-enyl-diphosphate synthase [Clostridiales bacterium]|nr:flavodoxin-dependent (E)-4-hydroxy-3-methylbut-2-enyl-diphosphate synthase [Clostridiales bacterium]